MASIRILLGASTLIATSSASAAVCLVDSRDAALTTNLSSCSAVKTAGYHAAADGGGATFKNVGKVTPLDAGASFVDASGTNFQYVVDPGGIDVRQFGAKVDWTGSDSSATNDFAALQNAIDFAHAGWATEDRGGGYGAQVHTPKGTALLCSNSPLWVKNHVVLKGEGSMSTVLKMCDTWSASQVFITLGDPELRAAEFQSRLEDLQIYASPSVDANAGVSMVYSNNIQHEGGVRRIKVFAGHRRALTFEGGWGGAAYVTIEDVETHNVGGQNGGTNNVQIYIDYGTTFVLLRNLVVHGPSSVDTTGLVIEGGIIDALGFHTEGVTTGILVNITAAGSGSFRGHALTGGPGCTSLVALNRTNAAGNAVLGTAYPNGCRYTVLDGRPGASNVTEVVTADIVK